MAIVGPVPGAGATGLSTGAHYIAWRNYALEADAITSSAAAVSGFPLTNGATWAPYELWKSAQAVNAQGYTIELAVPQSVNCFGLYAHNMNSGNITVELQYSDNGSTWSTASGYGGSQLPPSDGPFVRIGTAQAKKWWRILLTPSGVAPQAGVVFIGLATQLYRAPGVGFVPPMFSPTPRVLNNRARAGGFLGRSIESSYGETGFEITHVPIAWARNSFEPILNHARTLPFFYAWDKDNYPDDTAFCFSDGELARPNYSAVKYMRVGMQFVALTA